MHIPVLLNEVLKYLNPQSNENFIDCTVGAGGHSLAILKRIKPNGKILGIDADLEVIKQLDKNLVLVQGNFKDLKKVVQKKNFGPINGILFDLGLSSWQLEDSKRGFSFKKDELLDMRFQPKAETAKDIVNTWPEKDLLNIFNKYGEERYSQRIARQIVEERKIKPIKTTFQLKEIILKVGPLSRTRRGQESRVLARIFQAIRIAVNDELENLKQGLKQSLEILESGGRLVVISFHSLEDRIVKNFFRDNKKEDFLKILTKKPITASEEEIKKNPRSRSAKLRAATKTNSKF